MMRVHVHDLAKTSIPFDVAVAAMMLTVSVPDHFFHVIKKRLFM
jgi:hypothetical protein